MECPACGGPIEEPDRCLGVHEELVRATGLSAERGYALCAECIVHALATLLEAGRLVIVGIPRRQPSGQGS